MNRLTRLTQRLGSIVPRVSFLFRLFGTFVAVMALVGAWLYQVQSREARRLVTSQGVELHIVRAQFVESAHSSAMAGDDPWRAVNQVLRQTRAAPGVLEARVISTAERAIAFDLGTDAKDDGIEHYWPIVDQVFKTGEPSFAAGRHGGREVLAFLSRIQLDSRPYVFVVEVDPILLTGELASLKRSFAKALALAIALALPLLYLLGGRALAGRFRAAEDQSVRDGLTGLNNQRAFVDRLQQEVARAQRFGEVFTLALVDIDDFKFVNDSGGHGSGDRVLEGLAAALHLTRAVDLPFRIGGDEFALILPQTGLDAAVRVVERLRKVASSRMAGATLSVGVAEFSSAGVDATALRDRADAALYEAKRLGRNRIVTFADIGESVPAQASAATLTAVRRLLTTRQMSAAFQPIWNLDTHLLLGYEGLARPAAEYGFAGPREAFAGAARLGRVDELDALCRKAVLAGSGDLPDGVLLFLNISPEVFDHGGGAAQRLRQEIEAAGLRPGRVVLELTEHASERIDLVIDQVRESRELGFQLALDDVGAGDAGLGLLGRVRPDYVKVDRGVVCSARDGGPGRAVLAAVVAYAGESGATVIAEGIETEEMLDVVRKAGTSDKRARIVGAQGYLLGRPVGNPPRRQAPLLTWPLPSEVSESTLASVTKSRVQVDRRPRP